jgi:hypothetical protein
MNRLIVTQLGINSLRARDFRQKMIDEIDVFFRQNDSRSERSNFYSSRYTQANVSDRLKDIAHTQGNLIIKYNKEEIKRLKSEIDDISFDGEKLFKTYNSDLNSELLRSILESKITYRPEWQISFGDLTHVARFTFPADRKVWNDEFEGGTPNISTWYNARYNHFDKNTQLSIDWFNADSEDLKQIVKDNQPVIIPEPIIETKEIEIENIPQLPPKIKRKIGSGLIVLGAVGVLLSLRFIK